MPAPTGARDPRLLLPALDMAARLGRDDLLEELLAYGSPRGGEERYQEHVAPLMVRLEGGVFPMGTAWRDARHFCGECPRHEVALSPFTLGSVAVTNELYALFDERRRDMPAAERTKPVTGVSWSEAVLFALWLGCRLPTEAEWEYACGGGSPGEWCCEDEGRLVRHAWYSENAGGVPHRVGTLEPNRFGLHDLHGSVWEWCADVYDEGFYGRSPLVDPLNHGVEAGSPAAANKVCRGGSVHALAEMCRTRYRQYEPADYRADDIGFRLARSARPARS